MKLEIEKAEIVTEAASSFARVTSSNFYELSLKLLPIRLIEKAHSFKIWDFSILDVLEATIVSFEGIHVLAY